MLEPQVLEGSALVANSEQSLQIQESGKAELSRASGRDNKENLWCTYCKNPKHTREKCWKLNGKPPSRERNQEGGQPRNSEQTNFTMNQPS